MQNLNALYIQGLKSYQSHDLTGAEKAFREILSINPRHAESMHMMAAIGFEVGRLDMAEELMQIALSEDPNNADFWFTLGNIYAKQNRMEQAVQTYSKATQLNPKHLGALQNIARICRDQGAHFRNRNMFDAAIHHYKRILEIRPDEEDYSNLGYIYYQLGRYQDAIKSAKEHTKKYPRSAKAYDNVAVCYDYLGQYEEALQYNERAAKLDPKDPIIHANMASTLKSLGRVDDAISVIRKSLTLTKEKAYIYSNLILTMLYASSVSAKQLYEESRDFGEKIADPCIRNRPFLNNRNPDRKLRIGYVSPDFRNHAVAYFLLPIFMTDRTKFEIFGYSKVELEDAVTENIKGHFDHWRDIKRMTDDAAADLIEKDQIDILVDLAGHTANNGLMIFARKPAPIQVTWLGYTATTGMKAIDYRLTDAYAEPEGLTEHLNTEKLWRLPDIFAAYSAKENSPAVIDHPPFEDNGYITFGCFNNFTKVTDPVLQTWAKIMEQVPDARLLLEITGIQSKKVRGDVEKRLVKNGLPLDRVILESRKPSNQYTLYNKIDMALDPFPAVGGTTSMDTLWMGVPFITLAGEHFGSRMGVSILSNVGLQELMAQNTDDYISIATGLAKDRDRLKTMRHNLRDRFAASPAMDKERFAKNMDAAYRQMWHEWLQGQGA